MGWSGRAPAPPATNLARGAKDKEHPMSHTLNGTVTVIGIDIGKNSHSHIRLFDILSAKPIDEGIALTHEADYHVRTSPLSAVAVNLLANLERVFHWSGSGGEAA